MAPRSAVWYLIALSCILLGSVAYGQTCNSLTELYTMSGVLEFGNTSFGAQCIRIIPQPPSRSQEVRSISVSVDPTFSIGDGELTFYSTWFPIDQERYTVETFTGDCCDSAPDFDVKGPIVTVVFNTTSFQDTPFYVRYSAQNDKFRTKFSMGLFQALIVAIGLPIVSLLVSWCTFRRGLCNEAGKTRRLSRKTPLAEKIVTIGACGIGMLFFFLLTFRVFG